MAVSTESDDALLSAPSDRPNPTLERTTTTYIEHSTFTLPKGNGRHYQQQYADMYFARLAQLKPAVEAVASEAWGGFELAGEKAQKVDRVLDVRQGTLCWVIGTAYMEMPLKPNVLEDIGKEHWIAAPPPRVKYLSGDGSEQMMLEDESGRLRLTGDVLRSVLLVTGAIVAVVGTENRDGDFEVLDMKVPDLPRQPQRWEKEDGEAALQGKTVSQSRPSGGKVAFVSGLDISGVAGDTLTQDLLLEWLLGEATGPQDQTEASSITRLIIAGNSISHGSPIPSREEVAAAANKNRGQRKYGYDSSAYNAAPIEQLDLFLSTLLPSIPVTLLPGSSDPTSTQLPQQPIHAAMFPHSRAYMAPPTTSAQDSYPFTSTTNPTSLSVSGWSLLATGGQPITDVAKYLPDSTSTLEIMESLLRWRLAAPTAPDTLWCYPFQDGDAFVLRECPHVFVVGNQPDFATGVIEGPRGERVRLLALPSFRETGVVAVVDLETLGVEVVEIGVWGEERRS